MRIISLFIIALLILLGGGFFVASYFVVPTVSTVEKIIPNDSFEN